MASKVRSPNMTVEQVLLADLCEKYVGKIDSVKTDAVSRRMKEESWEQLARDFNAQTTALIRREPGQLKHAFENMKQKAKKAAASRKVELRWTGGSPAVPQLDTVDNKLLALMGNRAVPLSNINDSDAVYNRETVSGKDPFLSCVSEAEWIGDLSWSSIALPTSVLSGSVELSTSAGSAALLMSVLYDSVEPSTSADSTALATSVVSGGVVASTSTGSAAVRPGTSWANRRRPRLVRPLRSVSSQAAAEKIAGLTNIQQEYYLAKQAIKSEQHYLFKVEHAKHMRLLDLQEQLAVKQLARLDK